ncbi:hypothetical protein KVR01_006294 [Diaporthe batatas]|uniref:uncharacterized protein n=1 Tax=Diaporthe batatas TaxID=748121 RepID=UPI001D03A831|nr:uncharacterized protein KVR01_006294 [Diaporthe batatas]KAG8164376.1 hypothetical protein KVR01_006294 [Diaporthe batatas]
MDNIRLASAPVLLDDDSLRVSPDWRMRLFPHGAEDARRAINAMNTLQSTRGGAIDQYTVDQCVEFQLQYLPAATSSLVSYIAAGSTANPTHLFNTNLYDTELRTLSQAFWIEHREFFRHIIANSWTMFPIGVRGHFLLAIIRATQAYTPEQGYIAMIDDLVVLDPLRDKAVETFAYERLRYYILLPTRGFEFAGKEPASLWYPEHGVRASTCGLRFYEIVRVMIERISQSVGEKGLRVDFDESPIWRDLSGDFQADKVRAEMIGIMANRAMRATDWTTRICLVPVSHVKNRTLDAERGSWVPTGEHGSRLYLVGYNTDMQYNNLEEHPARHRHYAGPPSPSSYARGIPGRHADANHGGTEFAVENPS